jgi:hypothetical protein
MRDLTINPWESRHFIHFSIAHKETGDIDPVYPVLRKVQYLRKLDPDQAVWSTLLYFTWYHLGSAEFVWRTLHGEIPERLHAIPALTALPTGVERRSFRGVVGTQKAIEMLNYILRHCSPLSQWLREITSEGGERGWSTLYEYMKSALHNGPWAAYKWCDLARNVLNRDITASDIGVGGQGQNAGPVPGLVKLTGLDWKKCACDYGLQRAVYQYFRQYVDWAGMEEFETALCDYNSTRHRRYYVGHDIDKQQEDFEKMEVPPVYWEARRLSFSKGVLGEMSEWSGVRKELMGYIDNVCIVEEGY